jgi:hypothetical protein
MGSLGTADQCRTWGRIHHPNQKLFPRLFIAIFAASLNQRRAFINKPSFSAPTEDRYIKPTQIFKLYEIYSTCKLIFLDRSSIFNIRIYRI